MKSARQNTKERPCFVRCGPHYALGISLSSQGSWQWCQCIGTLAQIKSFESSSKDMAKTDDLKYDLSHNP